MAIFAPNHRHIGKTTQARPGTAGAHVNYITRRSAASLVLGEHMPTGRQAARAWMDEREATDRKNGRVCDKLMLPLPIEMDAAQRADLVRDFMAEVGGGRVSWLAAIHDQGEDAHNPHAHVVLRDKDHETGKRVFGTSEKGSTDRIRELWETAMNRALERGGFDARVDRRSLKDQGIDRTPGIHIGPNVLAMEERGLAPISEPQVLDNGRVIDWPGIDQGRTRADRQREIEQENAEREADREREKGGKVPELVPVAEPTPEAVPLPQMEILRVPTPASFAQPVNWWAAPQPEHQAEPRVAAAPEPAQEPQRAAQAGGPELAATSLPGTPPEATQRPSYEAAPLANERDQAETSRLRQILGAARTRLTDLAGRLETAWQRIRERSPPPAHDVGRDAAASTPAAVQRPEPERPRQVEPPAPPRPPPDFADDLLAEARRRREAEPDRERRIEQGRTLFPDYRPGRKLDGPGL